MPKIAFSTQNINNPQIIKDAVSKLGYRMFDCAANNKNEQLVGDALQEVFKEDKNINREDLFITSKVWWDKIDNIESACRHSMKQLHVDYLDLYLVQWPFGLKEQKIGGISKYERIKIPMHKVWHQMQ